MTMKKKNGLICPNCSIEMDFITFLKAPTPWHLKCNICQTKLRLKRYRGATTLFAFILGIVLGLLLLYLFFLFINNIGFFFIFGGVFFIFSIVLFEIIGYTLARKFDFGLEVR
ncbi:MAG: hypothetical protein ACFFDC_14470 [Promethearchaeota archaeon]